MMLVTLNRKRRYRFVAVRLENRIDVFLGRFEAITGNEWPQNEYENVKACHPTGNLKRIQEKPRVSRRWNHIGRHNQYAAADGFRGCSGSGIVRDPAASDIGNMAAP